MCLYVTNQSYFADLDGMMGVEFQIIQRYNLCKWLPSCNNPRNTMNFLNEISLHLDCFVIDQDLLKCERLADNECKVQFSLCVAWLSIDNKKNFFKNGICVCFDVAICECRICVIIHWAGSFCGSPRNANILAHYKPFDPASLYHSGYLLTYHISFRISDLFGKLDFENMCNISSTVYSVSNAVE